MREHTDNILPEHIELSENERWHEALLERHILEERMQTYAIGNQCLAAPCASLICCLLSVVVGVITPPIAAP